MSECDREKGYGSKNPKTSFVDVPLGDVPSLTDFEGGGLMEENMEGDDSPENRESSDNDASSSSTLRNSYQVMVSLIFILSIA